MHGQAGSSPEASHSLPKHIPELDGLRAVAVLAVLMYHLSLPGFSLAWTSVLLFFVVSGFLITGILLDAREQPRYFRNFYIRRALRIFPIYYLSLLLVLAGGLSLGQDVADLGYYLTYTQNYLLGLTDFQARFPMLFNHSWSLALEEQFYLLWPLAVLWLSRRHLLILVLALFLLGPLARAALLLTAANPTFMYAALPTEVDSLAAGAGLATLVRSGFSPLHLARWAVPLLLASGLALLLMVWAAGADSFWHLSDWSLELRHLPFQTLMALFYGAAVAIACFGGGPVSWLLRLRPLRSLGRISYGVYLYHFPVFVLADHHLAASLPDGGPLPENTLPIAAKLLLTLALALLSWRLIESPLLRMKERIR